VGGWLFDQVMAGWDAEVAVPGLRASRSLQILGVGTLDLDLLLDGSVDGRGCAGALAVDAGLYEEDPRVQEWVHRARERASAVVTFWGEGLLDDCGEEIGGDPYRLTLAAQAFKRHALSAAVAEEAIAV
jgi:hypothetical protein